MQSQQLMCIISSCIHQLLRFIAHWIQLLDNLSTIFCSCDVLNGGFVLLLCSIAWIDHQRKGKLSCFLSIHKALEHIDLVD
jgi:uncharacterized protein involved in cysteine biosynthesis